MFGYLDESGAPGKAINNNDFLLLSLVIFSSEKSLDKAEKHITDLKKKLRLPTNYEFHCSRNTTNVQKSFIRMLCGIEFSFIVVAVKKDDYIKTASYDKLSKMLINEIDGKFDKLKIEMDSNPTLYHCLRKIIRERNLRSIKIRQSKSHSSLYVQVADYVANISARRLKKGDNSDAWYDYISDKMKAFRVIDE